MILFSFGGGERVSVFTCEQLSLNRWRWGRRVKEVGSHRRHKAPRDDRRREGGAGGDRMTILCSRHGLSKQETQGGKEDAKKRQSPYRDSLKMALLSNSRNSFLP